MIIRGLCTKEENDCYTVYWDGKRWVKDKMEAKIYKGNYASVALSRMDKVKHNIDHYVSNIEVW